MVQVLGISIYDKDIPTAVRDLLDGFHQGKVQGLNLCISATGAHGLIEAHKDPSYREVLDSFYINLPDGMPVVWVGRLKGARQVRRCYGPDFFEFFMRESAGAAINHFFCGGKEGVAESLQAAVREKFGNNRVTGLYCPPFRDMTDTELKELGQRITDSGAQVVWIGISTPKQERFARKLAGYTRVSYLITVGAAFDFHTDRVKQAPKWLQNIGMEWFFRLIMEPRRLFGRYLEVVPKFIWLNIKEFLDFYILKKEHI